MPFRRILHPGRRVEVREESAAFRGRAIGVDPAGCLHVKDGHGRTNTVMDGDVRLLE